VTLDAATIWPALEPWRGAGRWWIGLSGGLDSSLLLDLLAELRATHDIPPLAAIHVDHQLHEDSAHWNRHCEALCDSHSVPLTSCRVAVKDGGEGPEAAARAARYRAFESALAAGDLLLLAHHLDDQVETFFLRLMRGAGTRGLAGMPVTRPLGRGNLLRPLLAFSRSELEACADTRGLRWVEDASNADSAPDRNFLRRELLPRLASRWPGYRQSVLRSMQAMADAEQLLAGLDRQRLAAARGEAFAEPVLALDVLAPETAADLARLLRRWLAEEAVTSPPQAQLLEFSRQLLLADRGSQPRLVAGPFSLRRYRQHVHLCREQSAPADGAIAPGETVTLPGLGELRLAPSERGLRAPPAGRWELRFRAGGERCRPAGREHSQSLKKLLQECGVPPWQRGRLPLLYAGGELAAVADLWICEGHQAAAGEPAFSVCWRCDPTAQSIERP
jgi:tRNA(Ile)-lysidine synthase